MRCRGWAQGIAAGLLLVAPTVRAEQPVVPDLRVQVAIDVRGELIAGAGDGAAVERRPVTMEARFDFVERPGVPAAPASADEPAPPAPAARRLYRDARTTMRFGDAEATTSLGDDARSLLVARRGTTPVPYLAAGFLSGEEFELLDVPFDSLLLEEMLPKQPVAVGETWEIAADVTAGLLAIDTVESGTLEAKLVEIDEAGAKVSLTGIIDGAADGVPTHVTVEGSFQVPARAVAAGGGGDGEDAEEPAPAAASRRLEGPIAGVAVVLLERREVSHVAPGFDVEARISISRDRAEGVATDAGAEAAAGGADRAGEGDAVVAGMPPSRRAGAGGPGLVCYRDPAGRFELVHDVGWRRVEEGDTGLVMRLVDRGALVGQCSITALPAGQGAVVPGREDVRRDVERSLAGQVHRIDAAEEVDRPDGLRIVRVASSGTAGRLPFRWIHYVVAAPDGRRAGVTFMFEEALRDRFGGADRSLVEGLGMPAGRAEGARAGGTAAVPADAGQTVR